jgi:hypothetical protein
MWLSQDYMSYKSDLCSGCESSGDQALKENWILDEFQPGKSGIGPVLFISILLILISQEFDLVIIVCLFSKETLG